MFKFKGLVAIAAASAFVASPAMAAGQQASALSLTKARAAAPGKAGSSRLAEGNNATLINVGILAALTAIVLVATTSGGDDDDSPASS